MTDGSYKTTHPVTCTVKWGNIPTVEKIKVELHRAIVFAIEEAVAEVIREANKIVPESRFGDYPLSYDSQKMLRGYLKVLAIELTNLAGGQSLRDKYVIQENWEAKYSRFVSDMGFGTNFTKPGAQPGFIETLHALLATSVVKWLSKKINSISSLQLTSSKYVGVSS
jgi:hypothetical protein